MLYDNGGLRFVLHGEGCKPGRNSSTVMILLFCRHGSDLGQPELFSKVISFVSSREILFVPDKLT